MKIIYPAIFHEHNNGYRVEFPDVEGCYPEGNTLEEALGNAREALSLHCGYLLESKKTLSIPTDIRHVPQPEDGFVSLVETEVVFKARSVKKTLSIPAWLNELAESKGINFSSTLQNALIKELNIFDI